MIFVALMAADSPLDAVDARAICRPVFVVGSSSVVLFCGCALVHLLCVGCPYYPVTNYDIIDGLYC